jgi:aerobic-type carbon monoxide dehydrogenase small subunit (CoxS/CutS family)
MEKKYSLTINGKAQSVTTEASRPLLDVLREEWHFTGTKYGCGEGRCGACTVLMDGKRIFSCLTNIEEAEGRAILTIEGLAQGEKLHPVQQAFVEEAGFQCGYCTPGMIMNAVALLETKPAASEAEITAWMNRNLCRCCGYVKIQEAVQRAQELSKNQK